MQAEVGRRDPSKGGQKGPGQRGGGGVGWVGNNRCLFWAVVACLGGRLLGVLRSLGWLALLGSFTPSASCCKQVGVLASLEQLHVWELGCLGGGGHWRGLKGWIGLPVARAA
jgi:hypothetical protein